MYSFENDYSEGACREVLEELIRTNDLQVSGYGLDRFCLEAAEKIRKLIGNDRADVHFITGGTPCNVLAISLLKAHEAVISVGSGHINVHETGAVEATGHKIVTVKGKDGKILPEEIRQVVKDHGDEHMVKPKMVFLANATEYGTVYTYEELKKITRTCHELGLYLYLDGARLSNALCVKKAGLDLKKIASLADIFYIGATKNGALLGEAMVIINDELKPDFRYLIKQKCSMLAKGRSIGASFNALLTDDVYLKNASHANRMAQKLRKAFEGHGIRMYIDSPSNQIFPILDNKLFRKLKKDYVFLKWSDYDAKHTVARFVCSWATDESKIDELNRKLDKEMK